MHAQYPWRSQKDFVFFGIGVANRRHDMGAGN